MEEINLFIIFFVNFLSINGQGTLDNMQCTDSYCKDVVCPDLPENCLIQNSTHSGIFLPYPDFCNCCQYCLVNLAEGAPCAVGAPGAPPPATICGPGLSCISGTCQNMKSDCTKAQDLYDKKRKDGSLGIMEVKPQCDSDGLFVPYKCISGQSCFCVDEKGERIFGEIDYTDTAWFHLKCGCSRKLKKAEIFFGQKLGPSEFFRCTETGDYDELQCIEDKCFCVDASDGTLTDPKTPPVKIGELGPGVLPCYDDGFHVEKGYYFSCAETYVSRLNEVLEYTGKDGYDYVFDYEFPSCTADGKFAPVQQKKSTKYCAFSNGTKIGSYEVRFEDGENMDCNCARTSAIMSLKEKPKCCPNGNFNKVQCRRGYCYCVNRDGYQIEREKSQDEIELLSCYKSQCDFSVNS